MLELIKLVAGLPYWSWIGMAIGLFVVAASFLLGYNATRVPSYAATDTPRAIVGGTLTHPFAIPGNAKVAITSPKDGETVQREMSITIQTDNLPSQFERWILVFAPGIKLWYPTEVLDRTPTCTVSLTLGSETDEGASFKILLFVTDQQGDATLRAAGDGTAALPRGVVSEVTVKRSARGA